MKASRRICLINAFAAPMTGSRAERWTNLCEALQELGVSVTAVVPETPPDLNGNETEARRLESACTSVVRLPGGKAFAAFAAPSGQGVSWFSRMAKRSLWPDPSVVFALRAERWLQQQGSSFDAVITSVKPASDLLVGYAAHHSLGVPWFADYGDPWALTPTPNGARKTVSFDVERLLLESCSGLFVTTEPTRRIFVERYDLDPARVHTVPAAVPKLDYPEADFASGLRLFHAGVVYGPRASISPFFDALERARSKLDRKIHMRWYGDVHRPAELKQARAASDVFEARASLGEVEQGERDANVLVVFGNHGGLQIPAKIWRSLGSGRCVLVIVADEDDPMAELSELDGRAIRVRNCEEDIFLALKELDARGPLPQDRRSGELAELPDWRWRASQIVQVLEEATPPSPVSPQEILSIRRLVLSRTACGWGFADQLAKLRKAT